MRQRLKVDELLPMTYPQRVGYVLRAIGVVTDEDAWSRAVQTATADEPAVCALDVGAWALELWHSPDLGVHPTAYAYWQAYREITHCSDLADIEIYLYVADIADAYCILRAEGDLPTETINLFCDVRVPAFPAAVIAQQMGLPLYSVVGSDDADMTLYNACRKDVLPDRWSVLRPYMKGHAFREAFPDVLFATCSLDAAGCAMENQMDTNGYLLDTMGARARDLVEEYRLEAESRNDCLIVVPFHPYLNAVRLWWWLAEHTVSVPDAIRNLEEQSGWEIPACLRDDKTAGTMNNEQHRKYGE